MAAKSTWIFSLANQGMVVHEWNASGPGAPATAVDWDELPEDGDLETRLSLGLEQLSAQGGPARESAAIILLPDSWFNFKTLALPFSSRKHISQIIDYELAPLLPHAEFETGIIIAGPCFSPTAHLALTGSMDRSRLTAVKNAFSQAGIDLRTIAPRGHALGRAAPLKNEAVQAVVYMENKTVVLTLFSQDVPFWIRCFHLNHPTDLAGQIRASLSGVSLKFGCRTDIPLAVMAQGENMAEDAIKALAEDVHSPTGIRPVGPPLPLGYSHLCTGRPFPLINLITSRSRMASFFQDYPIGGTMVGCLSLIVMGLFMVQIWTQVFRLEHRISQRKAEVATVFKGSFPDKTNAMGASPLMTMQALVTKARQGGGGESPAFNGPPIVRILAELSRGISAEGQTIIHRLNLGDHHLSLDGSTEDFNQVDRIKTGLSSSTLFKTVTITHAQADPFRDRVRFKFALTL